MLVSPQFFVYIRFFLLRIVFWALQGKFNMILHKISFNICDFSSGIENSKVAKIEKKKQEKKVDILKTN
jgi:hypothetical protein